MKGRVAREAMPIIVHPMHVQHQFIPVYNDTINMGNVTRGGEGRFTCNNCCTCYEQNSALDDLVCTNLPTNLL